MKDIQKKLTQYWENNFDRIYCLFYTPYKKERLIPISNELQRVGILNAKNFTFFYDCSSPYDEIMYKNIKIAYHPGDERLFIKKLSMKHYQMLKISYNLEYKKILIIEDDMRFLKDLNNLYDLLLKAPKDADITLFDKMIWKIPNEIYNKVFNNQLYLDYSNYNLFTLAFSSTGCYAVSRNGMDELITNYENALTASDTYTNNVPGLSIKMGCKKYVINENLAIQESPGYYMDHYSSFIDFNKYNLLNSKI